MIMDTLARATPRWVMGLVPPTLRNRIIALRSRVYSASLPSYNYLRSLMSNYQIKDLANVDPRSFRERIDGFLQLQNAEMEGFKDPKKQRDLATRFHWGHDHDFGEFSLSGRMADRHISLLATFIDRLDAVPRSLDGMRVLDVGCWTGGTSLLLCAMGAHVVAIDEVKKYIVCLNYLKYAFDIDSLEPKNLSLYECTTPDFQDAFDIVLFAGVLYHVTDPILALRITFNSLKDGGVCLLETEAIYSNERILSYEGPTVFAGGSVKDLSRTGWNWYIPSLTTLGQMMTDVGYTDVQVSRIAGRRAYAVGKRHVHTDMLRSGLSARNIR
jgi:2-polyprenyl-3-methyl-5-hydroxy-6-metoxy-1,4-benzoquinol methylase